MKLSEYPRIIVDTWTVHEVLRRLGFSADDIFVLVARDGRDAKSPLSLFVELRAQGKTFSVTVGPLKKLDPDRLMQLWTQFSEDLLDFSEADLQHAYDHGPIRTMGGETAFLIALTGKDFRVPKSVAKTN